VSRARWGRAARALVLSAALGLGIALGASAKEREVHGESSEFAGQGITMAWGILRAPAEADTQVVLRVARAGADHVAVSVDGVDPFTGRRQTLLALSPFGESLDIRSPRETFADLPRREIHFYTAADRTAGRPSLTVYFLGVPDTTPEFASEAALDAYLNATLRKLRGN
jgi:hypothetical protein